MSYIISDEEFYNINNLITKIVIFTKNNYFTIDL